jgi:hypothetical protein
MREYIEARVEKIPEVGCWIWLGHLHGSGYPRLYIGTRPASAHRIAYETYIGEIPAGKVICHHCDTPSCVNPAHLYAGSRRDNRLDAVKKGRHRNADRFTEAEKHYILNSPKSAKQVAIDLGRSWSGVKQFRARHLVSSSPLERGAFAGRCVAPAGSFSSSLQPPLKALKYFHCVHMATVSYGSNDLSRA